MMREVKNIARHVFQLKHEVKNMTTSCFGHGGSG